MDDWIARIKARGHAMLEEKLSLFRAPRGRSAWGVYALPLRSQRNFAAEAAGKSGADVVAEVVVQRGWREA